MKAYNVADLAKQAKARLPRGIWEFIARGAEEEVCIEANLQALRHLKLCPRVLTGVQNRILNTNILGVDSPLPFGIGPAGTAGLAWYDGEIEIAKAAAKAGIPYSLSTGATVSIERIAAEVGGRLWFQLYLWTDREASWALVDRVERAGVEALILTVDTAVLGNREYNARNGFTFPYKPNVRATVDMLMHPRWMMGVIARYVITGGMPKLGNYPQGMGALSTAGGIGLDNEAMNWEDLRILRSRWPRKLIVKGILHPDDAVKAVQHGADAIVVSNHGGRNLDTAIASINALPGIAKAVGRDAEVIFDSGVRRGSDILKALAMGADFVLMGRAPLYGVAAAGSAGVSQVIDFMTHELSSTMAYCGCSTIAEIDANLAVPA